MIIRDLKSTLMRKLAFQGFSFTRYGYVFGAIVCIVMIAKVAVSDPLPLIQIEQSFKTNHRPSRGNLLVTRDHKYLIAALEDECAVYSRDVENGKLELVQRLFEKPNPVDAKWIAATADESSIFLYSSDPNYLISHYQREAETGKLVQAGGIRKVQPFDFNNSIRHMLVHPIDGRLFALCAIKDALLVFRSSPERKLTPTQVFQDDCAGIKDPFSGSTTLLVPGSVKVDRLRSPYVQCLSRDGHFLYVGAGGDHSGDQGVAVFDLRGDSVRFVESVGDPPMYRVMGTEFPQALVVSPDDRHLYLGCAAFSLVTFTRNSSTGKLQWVHTIGDGNRGFLALDRITTMAMSQSGDFLYVGAIRDKVQSAFVVFRRHRETGRLELSQSFDDQEKGRISNMTVSPDGKFLYSRYDNMHIGVRSIPESWR